MDTLNRLYFHKYRINLKPKEQISLPAYKGSTLRGVFGHAIKKVVCVTKNANCEACLIKLKCVYSVIMESPIPQSHPFSRKYKNAPHPYIIRPPLTKKQYFTPDDSISFDIVLIGAANEYLPYFIFAFTEMGKIGIGRHRGKFEVSSVEALSLDGKKIEIFNTNTGELKSSANRIDYSLFEKADFLFPASHFPIKDELTISFETPVRLKEDNKLSRDLPFNLLIKRLSERAFLLSHFHCGAELADSEGFAKGSEDVKTLQNNLRWFDWERYSTRQDARMKFGGWIGEITYKDVPQRFTPLLLIGEHIHVGKAVTFGLGKYKINW